MSTLNTESLIHFIRGIYGKEGVIPLHAPSFSGNEKDYVNDTIQSTFVSSVGKYVDQFEADIENFTGSKKAVATINGTAALHTALYLCGITTGDLVITQPLTFVATCNALTQLGAEPIFVDVAEVSLGLCPNAVETYLDKHATVDLNGNCIHRVSGRPIKAVLPMHTFGHPVELDELLEVCKKWQLALVEDAAESLGSWYKNSHTGTFGDLGILSFNGNKIITTGGGGMILCQDPIVGDKAKHITTTAKKPHPYEYFHDEMGFNYRLPNINAALGCAQLEGLPTFLRRKRELAAVYRSFFEDQELTFVDEPGYGSSNFWLNAVICPDRAARDRLLTTTNEAGVLTRPVWTLMHHLPMYERAFRGDLPVSERMEQTLVNLPSSPPPAENLLNA